MTTAIIVLQAPRATSQNKIGDFEWSEKHQAHIWQGRELTIDEFNSSISKILKSNQARFSTVYPRIIETVVVPTLKEKRADVMRRNRQNRRSLIPA